jgi:ubiquinone/menaquinone biosynthesis C-methylase UbiE
MSRFTTEPRTFFDTVYQDAAPWDIGAPQPAISDLLDEYPPSDPILDVGCGTGDLAIWLAQRGHRVVGIDFAEGAIALANQRAVALRPPLPEFPEFGVGDAFQLSLLHRQFGAIVDSGFFHLFEPHQRERFVDELAAALPPGGRYYLLGFAIEFDMPNTPLKVSEEELRERFTPEAGWRILDVRDGQFLSRIAPVPAIAACIERIA